MEHYYTSYTKTINNTTYYFVKKYTRFPELKNVPAILENYGMHTNFDKACTIAAIFDPALRQQLFKEAAPGLIYGQNITAISAKPLLSKSLRLEHVNSKTVLATRLTGIKRIITAKIPHWRLLPHS
jgi:hypothetical protein